MCGRFALSSTTNELITAFVAAGGRAEDWRPTYSIAPTTSAPIVRIASSEQDRKQRELTLARWDWPKPPNRPAGGPIINARIEKLTSRFWVGAFSHSRCLVPMAPGYIEWTGAAGDKQPHLITGDGLLAAAGLTWTTEISNARARVFVVVTREARDASGEVHDRMPAFVTPDLWEAWLDPTPLTVDGDTRASASNRDELLALLEHSSESVARTMRTHLVDRRLNNSRTVDKHDPSILNPIATEDVKPA